MMREAMAHGLGNQGWSMPIWGPQRRVRAVQRQPQRRRRELGRASPAKHAKDILLVSHLMHQQAMRIINNEIDAADRPSSRRASARR